MIFKYDILRVHELASQLPGKIRIDNIVLEVKIYYCFNYVFQ